MGIDADARKQIDALWQIVRSLRRMTVNPPLEIFWLDGVPLLIDNEGAANNDKFAKLTEDLLRGDGETAKAKVQKKRDGEWQETEEEIEITQRMEWPIPAGRRVHVRKYGDEWHVINAERVPLDPVIDVCCDSEDVVAWTNQIFVDCEVVESESNPCGAAAATTSGESSVDTTGSTEEPPEEEFTGSAGGPEPGV